MRRQWFVFALAILLIAGPASAQHKEWWGFFSGSWVMPMGETADNLDDDFGLSGGVLWRPARQARTSLGTQRGSSHPTF